jgi:hypothetical protein
MEPYTYSYPEEEQQKPVRPVNRGLLAGLLIGLLIGGVLGYVLGIKTVDLPGINELFTSPILLLSANAAIVLLVLVLVLLKRSTLLSSKSISTVPTVGLQAGILILVLGLLMAGFIAFFIFERMPK